MKDPANKNKLIIDEAAANIIRMIFDLKIEGMNQRRIAEYLDELGVPSPAERLAALGYPCRFVKNDDFHWSLTAVSKILRDETYIGTMVQGKTKKMSFKNKKMTRVNKDDWVRVENAVPPVINKRTFEYVQDLNERDTGTAGDNTHVYLFSGFARCADCGQNMTRHKITQKGNTSVFYMCSEHTLRKTCSYHRIKENDLIRAVSAAIREQIEYLLVVGEKLKETKDIPTRELAMTSVDEKLKKALVERTEHNYALKGVVHCKNCGRRMIRSMSGTFSCHGKHQKDFTGCGGTWKEEEIEEVVLAELIQRGKQAAELLRSLKRDDYDVSGAKKEIADLKRELTSKYMAYVRKQTSQEDYMAFQKEVRAKTAELEGQITVTRGSNEHLEEVEDALKPLADGSVAAEKNGLTQAMVQELVENVWVGDEITVEFKADSMMRNAEDELVE